MAERIDPDNTGTYYVYILSHSAAVERLSRQRVTRQYYLYCIESEYWIESWSRG